jgi:putative redox protein
MDSINIKWNEKMSFTNEVDGHKFIIDAKEDVGGENNGPRPKPLILSALGGCTAMDVISILKKMRVEPDTFNVKVDGELSEEHPKHYYQIKITYELTGENLSVANIKKAVELSEERYCGVSYTLKQAMKLISEIKINGEVVE